MQTRPKIHNRIVAGVHAPPPKPTLTAALLVATLLSLPFLAMALVEVALRW